MVSAAKPTAAPSITTKIKAVDTPVTLPEKVNMRNEEEEEGNEATTQQNENTYYGHRTTRARTYCRRQ